MLSRTVGLLIVFPLLACATAKTDTRPIEMVRAHGQPKLFVGHGPNGELVVAASHYDAMNGLAVPEEDLGLPPSGDGEMLCERIVATGSHVPHWQCRYSQAADLERELTRNLLSEARLSFDKPPPQIGLGTGMTVGVPGGGGPGHSGTITR